jgi:hypothetical protein
VEKGIAVVTYPCPYIGFGCPADSHECHNMGFAANLYKSSIDNISPLQDEDAVLKKGSLVHSSIV